MMHAKVVGDTAPKSLAETIAAYHRANNLQLDYDSTVESPARAALAASEAAVPHLTTVNSYMTINGERLHLSTSSLHMAQTARAILPDREGRPPRDDDERQYLATLREIIELTDKRDEQVRALRATYRYDDVEAQSNALSSATDAAITFVFAYPVTTIAELVEKVTFVTAQDAWDEAEGPICADIRRLAAGAVPGLSKVQS